MDLSIIILNYKAKNLVKQLLLGLAKLNLPFEYEIIVVDNNSQDKVGEMIKENFPNVIFIQNDKNTGFAAGNNLAIPKAKGRYLLLLNTDIVIVDDAIQKLYDFMETHPTVGLAGPQLIYPNKEIQESCARLPSLFLPLYRRTFLKNTNKGKNWLGNYFYRDWDHQSNKTVDWLYGACLIVRKENLIKVGLLDEHFFLYFEDADWSRRFWLAGYQVYYVADSKMYHYHRRSSAEQGLIGALFNKSSREHIFSFIKYLWKYRSQPNPHK